MTEAAAAALPAAPKKLFDHFLTGPMSAEAVAAASMVFKKALAERAGEVATGREAVEIADAGAEGRRGDQAQAAGLLQALAAHIAAQEVGEVLFDGDHGRCGCGDLVDEIGQGVTQGHGQLVLPVFERRHHRGTHLVGAGGNGDAELAQQAAKQIDRGGALRLVVLTDAMQALDALLLGRLHRHRAKVGTAVGFEQACGIGAIGLVATDVRPHVVRWEQDHRMPETRKTPRPVMSGATGFHDHAPLRSRPKTLLSDSPLASGGHD